MKKLTLFLFMVCTLTSWAQDPHFSQYFASPLYMNPSFAGKTPMNRVILNHRIQWPALPQAFSTYSLSIDLAKRELNSGFGILATTDKAGSAQMRATTAGFIYSYNLQIENKWVVSPSVYFGYGSRSLNFHQLLFGDQLEFGNSSAPTVDPAAGSFENINYFDAGAGLLFYNKNTWIGASYWHINQPNISFLDVEDRIPAKLTVHAGTTTKLNNGTREHPAYLMTSVIYNWQGPFHQMDFGFNYHMDPLILGLWFRGIPLKKNVIGNMSRDALVLTSGMRFDQFKVQYSFDFTISELGVRSQGAHEISLDYQFKTPHNPKRVPRRMKILPCPSYIPYESYKMRKN